MGIKFGGNVKFFIGENCLFGGNLKCLWGSL